VLSEGSSEKYGMVLDMIFTSFFPIIPLACLVTWNTGPSLMVDPNVKPFVGLVARKNSMKLITGCVIP